MPASIGSTFIVLDTVGSTNIHAMEQYNARLASSGTVFFAREQTHGRGQRGRNWASSRDADIAMSVLWVPESEAVGDLFLLSAATAVACRRWLERLAGAETSIKWPNDLYWRDRKAGGILIENVIRGSAWVASVIGIGVNVNGMAFSEDLPNPVSLRQVTGREWDTASLARGLCAELDLTIRSPLREAGPERMREYNACLYGSGRRFDFRTASGTFNARVRGVNERCELLLEKGGEVTAHPFGSIGWELPGTLG